MTGYPLSLLPVSFLLAAVTAAVLVRVSARLGHVDRSGTEAHKRHEGAIPDTGGIAIMVAVLFPLGGAAVLAHAVPFAFWQEHVPALSIHIPGLRSHWPLALALLASALIIHVLGLIDDRRGLSPTFKLIVQCAVAAGLVIGFDVRVMRFLGGDFMGPAGDGVSIVITIVWFAAITNAVNMLDNMDGLAGGVALIIAAIYLAATMLAGQWFVACLCGAVIGAVAGFLIHNFPSARLFMGDSGALLVGWLLAFISVRTTYVQMPDASARSHWYGALMPLIVMAVPLYDLSSVVWLRRRAGRGIFKADNSHFSHRLVARGLTRRGAVLVVWLCTLATGLGGAMLHTLEPWQAIVIACQTFVVLGILIALERRTSHP